MKPTLVKHEEVFLRFLPPEIRDRINPTELGRRQFVDQQSAGKPPRNPDPFYLRLCEGKTGFDFVSSEMQKAFAAGVSGDWGGWPGWAQLQHDFRDELSALELLTRWNRHRPEWLTGVLQLEQPDDPGEPSALFGIEAS